MRQKNTIKEKPEKKGRTHLHCGSSRSDQVQQSYTRHLNKLGLSKPSKSLIESSAVLRFMYPVLVMSTTEQMLGRKMILLLLLDAFFFLLGVNIGLGFEALRVDAASFLSRSSLLKYSISWETREAMVPCVPTST